MTTKVTVEASDLNEGRVIEVVVEDLSFGWCRTNILRDGERLEATVFDWQMVRVREADERAIGTLDKETGGITYPCMAGPEVNEQ